MTTADQTTFDVHGPVPVALDLGWEMVEVYDEAQVRGQSPKPGDQLTTLSDLKPWQLTELGINYIQAALHRLSQSITDADLTVPDIGPVRAAFGGGDVAALRSAISDLHSQLLTVLHATDSSLGKAYDLGRSLAYTCRRPNDVASLRAEFRSGRLGVLEGWLADLATALPDHASRAVAISIGIWQEAIPDPETKAQRWQIQDDQVHNTELQLHRQAKNWRALLTGAKDGRDMLQAKDYAAAAGRLFGKAMGLISRFLVQTYFAVPLILGGTGYGVWVILTSHGKTAANIVGAITAAAAAFGITWKGTEKTLLQLAGKLEQPLWNSELDGAIGQAITTLKSEARQLRPAKIAAQIAPPEGPRLIEPPPAPG